MNLRLTTSVVSLAALAALTLRSEDARACGGCFHEESQVESTVVTGHRMAFSISPERTILWDQIEYAGEPASFAWVLPIKPGAEIQLASDAWFEVLEAATSAKVVSPAVDCPSFGGSNGGCSLGCGSMEAAGLSDAYREGKTPPVTVVHQGTVGPYETVTLHGNVPGALPTWLTANGYAIDPTVQPIIDAYNSEGFDFIALRLLPGKGVQQMKPVRVVSPGMSPTLPLRMVAAGTGAKVGITLFVIGEGRWQAQNFANGQVDPTKLTWDFNTDSSNYASLRDAVLAGSSGRTWATIYAKPGTLFGSDQMPSGYGGKMPVVYPVGDNQASTIADAFLLQGQSNGEATDAACASAFASKGNSTAMVSGDCLGQGSSGPGTGGQGTGGQGTGGQGTGTCSVPAGMLDARDFACGELDDLAAALVGLHPASVTITRLEANLPRAALADDLVLHAAAQTPVDNYLEAKPLTDPCAAAGLALIGPAAKEAADFRRNNKIALAAGSLLLVGAAIARRRRRRVARAEIAG